MSYFSNNKMVKFKDLEEVGVYGKYLIDSLKARNFKVLLELPIDNRADSNFMEPILYAVKNELNTYEVFKYYANNLQEDFDLAKKIVREEPSVIQGTCNK